MNIFLDMYTRFKLKLAFNNGSIRISPSTHLTKNWVQWYLKRRVKIQLPDIINTKPLQNKIVCGHFTGQFSYILNKHTTNVHCIWLDNSQIHYSGTTRSNLNGVMRSSIIKGNDLKKIIIIEELTDTLLVKAFTRERLIKPDLDTAYSLG